MTDLVSLTERESLVRTLIERDIIDLKQFGFEPYAVPQNHVQHTYTFPHNGQRRRDEICEVAEKTVEQLVRRGAHDSMLSPVYEAILNAAEHGSTRREDPVLISHGVEQNSAIVSVSDSSGIIDPAFLSYVLRIKQDPRFIPFYEHAADRTREGLNRGLGTYLMHASSKPEYYASPLGGLTVVLKSPFER